MEGDCRLQCLMILNKRGKRKEKKIWANEKDGGNHKGNTKSLEKAEKKQEDEGEEKGK